LKQIYNKFSFDKEVNYWIDFSQTNFSSHNRLELPLFEGVNEFKYFREGETLLKENELLETGLEDKFRFFLEDSDLIDTIQMVVDTNSGYGSLSTEFLKLAKDELPKNKIFLYSISNPLSTENKFSTLAKKNESKCLQGLNLCLSLSESKEYLDLITPIHLDELTIPSIGSHSLLKPSDSLFSITSIPALSIHSLLFPLFTRSLSQIKSSDEMIHAIAIDPHANIYDLNAQIPFLNLNSENGIESTLQYMSYDSMIRMRKHPNSHRKQGLSACVDKMKTQDEEEEEKEIKSSMFDNFVSYEVVRAFQEGDYSQNKHNIMKTKSKFAKLFHRCWHNQNLLLPIPFPRYFNSFVGTHGIIDKQFFKQEERGFDRSKLEINEEFISQIGMFVNLSSGPDIKHYIMQQYDAFHKSSILIKNQFLKDGFLEADDFEQIKNEMLNYYDTYNKLKMYS
jgi:hypothetical protein